MINTIWHINTFDSSQNNLLVKNYLHIMKFMQRTLPVIILIILPLLIFYHHITGAFIWIGNSDRLNSHLKVLRYHVEGIAAGHLSAWSDHEMMGYDTFTLPYTFPNPLTYISYLLGIDNLYIASGYISFALLMLAGIAAYLFIQHLNCSKATSLVGAICYQFSTLTLLKVSQNDMSFAVFIIIPIAGLIIQKIKSSNIILSYISLTTTLFLMLNFMFLQKASYALMFMGSYALYKSISQRTKLHFTIFGSAFITAFVAALPRIYGIKTALSQYARMLNDNKDLTDFATFYNYHHIFPSEIFRWFDYSIFGRYPSETAPINQMNMTEGFLLYTSAFVPFLIIYGLIRYQKNWFRSACNKINDSGYFFWFLIFTFGVIVVKPLGYLIFILYQRMDFTHARILIAGLLPLVTLIALILQDIYPQNLNSTVVVYKRFTFLAAIMASIIIVGSIEIMAHRQIGYTIWPIAIVKNLHPLVSDMFRSLHLMNAALIRVLLSGLVCILFIFGLTRVRQEFVGLKLFLHQCLCFCIIFQVLTGAYVQVNAKHITDLKTAFANGNFHYARHNDFTPPTNIAIHNLKNLLENKSFRTIMICDPVVAGGFCAGHMPEFWQLRSLDGYYGIGVPSRLSALPWPDGVVSLRTISFNNSNDLPWRILGLLNVKYALVVTPTIYRNSFEFHRNSNATEFDKITVLKNPEPVVPRAYFTAAVRPVDNIADGVGHLFQNALIDVTKEAAVEGIKNGQQYINTGKIILTGEGDRLEVTVEKSTAARFLVLNELYFPGWTAKINNKEIPILPANVTSRGLIVPAGTEKILLQYTPFVRSHKALYFYGASTLLFISCILIAYYRSRKTDFF